MPLLVDVDTAARELRITLETGEDADLARKLAAAEEQVAQFLGRRVYATQEDLDAAYEAAPDLIATADADYETAMSAAAALSERQRDLGESDAASTWREAQEAYRMARRGMVVNDSIKTAILLIAGSLWEHRGDEDAIIGVPPAARTFLFPFRTGMGV